MATTMEKQCFYQFPGSNNHWEEKNFLKFLFSRNVFKKGDFCQFLTSKIYDKIWHSFNIFCNFCVSEKFNMSPVYACYIRNCSPIKALGGNLTPYEAFFGHKPNVSMLQEFSSACWVMVPKEQRKKLNSHAETHIFVGIAEHSKCGVSEYIW